jgi:uncharacterized protein YgiM (DUF1202 family)
MPRSRWFVNDVRFLFLALGFMILTGCSQQPTPIVLVQTTIPPKTVEIATAIPTRSVIPSATPRPMVQPVAATMPPATTGPTCDEALAGLFQSASSLCLGRPYGLICNGGSAPQVEPAGQVSNSLASTGALVEVDVVDALHTPFTVPQNGTMGLAWIRLPDPILISGLLIGDVAIRDVAPPDFSAWQSIIVKTGNETPVCGIAPNDMLIIQSQLNQVSRLVINGVSVVATGATVAVKTIDTSTVFINLSGQVNILALGQERPLYAGEQIAVPYRPDDFSAPAAPPGEQEFIDMTLLRNVPVSLLDRPILLPQPGYVQTQGQVNLRSLPSADSDIILEVGAGEVMSVLGRNTAGDWYHVRMDSGETGWMLADILLRNVGEIQAVYDETPLPPQRYGELGLTGKVLAPIGVNLRSAPDTAFDIIGALPDGTELNLLARSPYSPWVKVEADGLVGWLALITLDTDAVIDALPIDYDVPPPPPPTRVPGSFGNAFPDPNEPGN